MNRRVLFIAYLFPPIANSGTQRPLKFAKYLSEYGWDPIVLTAAQFTGHSTDPHLFDELDHELEIVRVPMLHEWVANSLTRRSVDPSGSLRSDTVFTPSGVSSHVTSGISDIASTNCVPLKLPCRMTTWNGSTRFS